MRVEAVPAVIAEEHFYDFDAGLVLVHGVHDVQVVQGDGVDTLFVLVEGVHGVRIQLENLLNYLSYVIVVVIEVKAALFHDILELLLRILLKSHFQSSPLLRVQQPSRKNFLFNLLCVFLITVCLQLLGYE